MSEPTGSYYVLQHRDLANPDRFWSRDEAVWTVRERATVYREDERERSLLQGKWVKVQHPGITQFEKSQGRPWGGPEASTAPATEDRATARPWHVWDRGIGYEIHRGPLAECRPDCLEVNMEMRDTFKRADAELIVTAVNSYEASQKRIEALKAALTAITMIAGNLPDETLQSCGGIHEGRGRALMALSARSIARAALREDS